ncbi:cytochrome P450 4B1-like [Pholidichthys leucotaenia]
MDLSKALLNSLLDWFHVYHLLVVFGLVAAIYKLTLALIKRRNIIQNIRDFPGPPKHWLFGHAFEMKQDLDRMVKWGEQYQYTMSLWFGPFIHVINIQHPDYIKTMLTSSDPKDDFGYRLLESWIGDGLLVSQGQKWFRHRRLLTPGFHYDVLKPYVKLMSESANIMLNKWQCYAATNETFEMFEHVSLKTLDSILKCVFSCKTNCQTQDGKNAYIKAVYELSYLINLRVMIFPYHSNLLFHLSPHGFRYRKARRVAHNYTEEIIRKRKEELKDEKELSRIQSKRYLDFLDILLSAKDEKQKGLSDKNLRAEVDTFLFEGHDTTASGISFTLYCLACNPEHQKICRKEIIAALGDKDIMEWEDLSKIPYITMCIKESLHLYPPIPGMSRTITKSITFPDGRTLPPWSRIATDVYGLHRNKTVWENPDVFEPLRFLPENVAKRPPCTFVPFSAGPRNCIGQNFAMNEMKVVIALALKRYQLIEDPTHKPKLIPRLILRSLNGIHIKIKPID